MRPAMVTDQVWNRLSNLIATSERTGLAVDNPDITFERVRQTRCTTGNDINAFLVTGTANQLRLEAIYAEPDSVSKLR